MEESFYSTIKLVSGEEIFSTVCVSNEEDETFLLLDNPVVISPIYSKTNYFMGYKVSPWLRVTDDELFVLRMENIMTMTEVKDPHIISTYKKFLRNSSQVPVNNNIGLLCKIDEARISLEKIYKSNS